MKKTNVVCFFRCIVVCPHCVHSFDARKQIDRALAFYARCELSCLSYYTGDNNFEDDFENLPNFYPEITCVRCHEPFQINEMSNGDTL